MPTRRRLAAVYDYRSDSLWPPRTDVDTPAYSGTFPSKPSPRSSVDRAEVS